MSNNKFLLILKRIYNRIKLFFHVPSILGHDEHNDKEYVNSKNALTIAVSNSYSGLVRHTENIQNKIINKYHKVSKISNEGVFSEARGPLKLGLILIGCFFIFFGGWLTLAKVDGAVVAGGQVAFAQTKQNVQHQNGGIIKNILVKEGDIVHRGQALINLYDVDIRAKYNSIYNQVFALQVTEARLVSERNNSDKLNLNPELIEVAATNSDMADILKSQTRLFFANNDLFRTRLQMVVEKKKQLEQEIEGLEIQKNAVANQIKYNQSELETVEKLLKDGNVSKTRWLNLKSQYSQLVGNLGRYQSDIARSHQHIVELGTEELGLQNNRAKELEEQLKELSVNIANAQENLHATQDVMEKAVIKAPSDGIITNLHYHNSDEVIRPSDIVMEIIPENDYLIIEAKLEAKHITSLLKNNMDLYNYNHQDINHLLEAKINLSAYSSRRFNKLKGSVFYVAADANVDPYRGSSSYLVKIMISKKELENAAKKNMKLYPGMPAEVFVLTESRTYLSYLISPITSSFEKAFIDS